MKTINLAIVGLGRRGSNMLETFANVEGVNIYAVCDSYEPAIEEAIKNAKKKFKMEPIGYTDFEELIKDKNINAIYIATSWEEHINQSIRCMEVGIPVGMEVGGAYSLKDCWRLVNTYEKTKSPIMMMENCCYDWFELLTTAMVRRGDLGEVVHCHGAYSHDLRNQIINGHVQRHYRCDNYRYRNCENYPTHELGPIARVLNVTRGNRLVSMTSVASKSSGLKAYSYTDKNLDPSLKGVDWKQGDVVNTVITLEDGSTVSMTLSTTLPSFYSREFVVKGTKGFANQEGNMIIVDNDGVEEGWEPHKFFMKYLNSADKYKSLLPTYWHNITEEQIKLGHGGMDFFMCQAFIEAVRENKPMPIDVYDAATWYSITPISEKSIKHHGKPYKIPDFTRGKYKTRKPEDVVKFNF